MGIVIDNVYDINEPDADQVNTSIYPGVSKIKISFSDVSIFSIN